MRGLVGEERELGEQDAERARHEQLQPAVAEQDRADGGAAEPCDEHGEECAVEPLRTRSSPDSLTTREIAP